MNVILSCLNMFFIDVVNLLCFLIFCNFVVLFVLIFLVDRMMNLGSVFIYNIIIDVMIIEIDNSVNIWVVLLELGYLKSCYIIFCVLFFGIIIVFFGGLFLFRIFLIVLIVCFLSLKNFIFFNKIFGVNFGG